MRAQQIVELTGPENLEPADLDEPKPEHMLARDGRVVTIDVEAAGVAFPEVLQSRGEYQFKPDLPFVPGAEVGGVARESGQRVAACCYLGGFAEVAVAPEYMVFPIPDDWSYDEGAALVFN